MKVDLEKFFDFLKFFEISSFEAFCQRRLKKTGKRGGKFWGRLIKDYEAFEFYIQWANTQKFEAVMTARGLLLVDDVDAENLKKAKESDRAFAAIETSAGNYQLLFIGGSTWTAASVRTAQQRLLLLYGGDLGASAAGQLHRFPGSLNQKNGGSFMTRLVHLQTGKVMDLPAVIPRSPASMPIAAPPAPGDKTPSQIDFSNALRMIRAGKSREEIESAMLESACSRSNHGAGGTYAKATVDNAFRLYRARP